MMTHKIVETKLEKSRNNSRDINGYYRCHLLLCKVIPEILRKFEIVSLSLYNKGFGKITRF